MSLALVGPNRALVAPLATRLYSSDTARYFDTTDTVKMKRGRGGRGSFSGVVATVFGATGFLGKFVLNRLGAQGTQMIIPYRSDPKTFLDLKTAGGLGQMLFTEFHLNDEASIAKAVQHSHVVINLIGREFETRNFNYEEANAIGPARIARISKQMGVKRFVHLSAMNVDQSYEGYCVKGGSRFLKSKRLGEELVREEFPEAIIIRPAEMFGYADMSDKFIWYLLHWMRISTAELTGHRYRVPLGGRGVFKQPIYGGDVAQAIVNCAVKEMGGQGDTFQAVGPKRYEYHDIVDYLLRCTRRAGCHDISTTLIGDLKYNPLLLLQARINEILQPFQFYPKGNMVLDKIERETVTDVVDPSLPLIDELGVTRVEPLEGRGRFCAEMGQCYAMATPFPGEWPEVYAAKHTEPHKHLFSYT